MDARPYRLVLTFITRRLLRAVVLERLPDLRDLLVDQMLYVDEGAARILDCADQFV
jgi:hypothetical protein